MEGRAEFLWQVFGGVPQLKEGTVLMADYAGKGIPEDYGIWGPANLIYFPNWIQMLLLN